MGFCGSIFWLLNSLESQRGGIRKILFRLIGKDHWEQERLYKREFPKTYFDNAKIKISDISYLEKILLKSLDNILLAKNSPVEWSRSVMPIWWLL